MVNSEHEGVAQMIIAELLDDAKKRLETTTATIKTIRDQMLTLNARGVEQERILLGIDGEITALTKLTVRSGE